MLIEISFIVYFLLIYVFFVLSPIMYVAVKQLFGKTFSLPFVKFAIINSIYNSVFGLIIYCLFFFNVYLTYYSVLFFIAFSVYNLPLLYWYKRFYLHKVNKNALYIALAIFIICNASMLLLEKIMSW